MKYDIVSNEEDEPTSIYFSSPIELDGFNKISDNEYSIIGHDESDIEDLFEKYERIYGLKNEMEYDMYFHDTNSYLPNLAYILNNDVLNYRYWFVLTSYEDKHNKILPKLKSIPHLHYFETTDKDKLFLVVTDSEDIKNRLFLDYKVCTDEVF